jgi:hypothetical protein
MDLRRRMALARSVAAVVAIVLVVGLPLLALVLSGPGLATLVVAALTFLVAAATLYLHVADRRPRLSIHPVEAQYYRDGRVVARAYDFAKRRFHVHNAGTKPVKIEEVRVEFDSGQRGDFPATGVFLDVEVDGGIPYPVQPSIPGWLDRWQAIGFTADLGAVEHHLYQAGYRGPTKVRLVVVDALGNRHGRYFEVLARPEEGQMSKMRNLLMSKLRDTLPDAPPRQGIRIGRRQIEEWGTQMGLNPDESTRLFDDLKGIAWKGEYAEFDERGWTEARVRYIQ